MGVRSACLFLIIVQVTVFADDQVVYSATYDHVYDQNSEQVHEHTRRFAAHTDASVLTTLALLFTAVRYLQRLLPPADP